MPAFSLSIPAPRLSPSGCPGLLRIVPALDGGICRVRLTGGELTTAQAGTIADASERFSGGVIELTNRANLQLRGIRPDSEASLIDALLAAGLGPTHDGGDEVRNLMLSPTAGIDTAALIDTRPLGRQILDRLQRDFGHPMTATNENGVQTTPRHTPLSPKFAVQLDGGESLAMIGHHHDIWLTAMRGPQQQIVFGVGIAGSPPAPRGVGEGVGVGSGVGVEVGDRIGAVDSVDGHAILAVVTVDQVATLVSALIQRFLALAQPGETRLRHLLARIDAQTLFAEVHAALTLASPSPSASASAFILATAQRHDSAAPDGLHGWHRGPTDPQRRFGAVLQHSPADDRRYHLGAQPALGRMTPDMLRAVAALAERFGDGTLRLTPWQGLIVPGVKESDRDTALSGLRACGLIDSPTDPLGAVLACTGRPDCAKARADTKQDARLLASRLPRAVDVQLSGCERGCAAGRQTAYTLLAIDDGRYDLYRACDDRAATSAFGARIASELTVETAAQWLAQ